jgi:patatin-like phospholipase/acyl hydrolase
MAHNILSIDGGGIRGIIPATVLAEIEERADAPVSSTFDTIAGTSTGGILAAALARPQRLSPPEPLYSAEDVIGIYEDDGPHIFESGAFSWGLASPTYPLYQLTNALRGRFGSCPMRDLLSDVVMPTYDLEGRRPVIFSREKARHSSLLDVPVWKAAAATAAAPTFFPPVDFEGESVEMSCVDGGVYCNNPAALALREARTEDAWLRHDEDDRVNIVSIGTGTTEESIDGEKAAGWGLAGWAPKIIQIAMDGAADIADRHVEDLAGTREGLNYWRIQVKLGSASEAMDDVSRMNLAALKLDGRRAVRQNEEKIDDIVSTLF